jgi:aldose 1-epimerase
MKITKEPFGKLPGNRVAELFTLSNDNGMTAAVTNYGGIIVSLFVPQKGGAPGDVVLGYDTLDGYLADKNYFGCIVGRYANRIARGKFSIKGKEASLARNDGENHLHGGPGGFHKVLWKAEEIDVKDEVGLKLSYLSKEGEEGYPGNLSVTVTYMINHDNALLVQYIAETDKSTVVNLTQHSYFNLAGAGKGDVLGHELMISADAYTHAGAGLIPTGEIKSVEGTPLDFRKPQNIGSRIRDPFDQIAMAGGYDSNWVLNKPGSLRKPAAVAMEKATGRVMEVFTTEPGLQFYSGNFLSGVAGKNGLSYSKHSGFCLEAQHFPDSPNRPAFPSTLLLPGSQYSQTTIYRFSVAEQI